MRSTLVTGKYGEVYGAFEVVQRLLALRIGLSDTLAVEDHGSTRSTERLVRCRCYSIAVLEGRLVHAGGDQTGDMCHIHQQVASDLVGDLTHAGVVDLTAVGGGARDKDLRTVHQGVLLELVVVDEAGLEVYAVGERLEVGGDSRDPASGQPMSLTPQFNLLRTSSAVSGSRGSDGRRGAGQDPSACRAAS
jgi:hypothetical protein